MNDDPETSGGPAMTDLSAADVGSWEQCGEIYAAGEEEDDE